MKIRAYQHDDENEWDYFCNKSNNATFLHTRQFLNYHGSKFFDKSIIVEDEKNRICGLFPAAQAVNDEKVIISHPGITYGGLITDKKVYGDIVILIMQNIAEYYQALGFRKLIYKVIPHIYHKVPSQDDIYAIFRQGGSIIRRDLSATIELTNRLTISSRRKRNLNKAKKNNIRIDFNKKYTAKLWDVLKYNLTKKHGTKPVHSLSEILSLMKKFPDNIDIMVAILDNNVIAGLVFFHTETVTHAQYIASNDIGNRMYALDLLFDTAIIKATRKEQRYFDFGISNEQNGQVLNQSLYQFKHEFGAGGTVHDFYEVNLD